MRHFSFKCCTRPAGEYSTDGVALSPGALAPGTVGSRRPKSSVTSNQGSETACHPHKESYKNGSTVKKVAFHDERPGDHEPPGACQKTGKNEDPRAPLHSARLTALNAFLGSLREEVLDGKLFIGVQGGTYSLMRHILDEALDAALDPDTQPLHEWDTEVNTEDFPVLQYMPRAIENARAVPNGMHNIAGAFEKLWPYLDWWKRDCTDSFEEPFYSGHANAMIIGPRGLMTHPHVSIGVSLIQPNVTYPQHRHREEEIYLAMSEGTWFNETMGWYQLGACSIVHHRSWLPHTYRAGSEPFLNIWVLHDACGIHGQLPYVPENSEEILGSRWTAL